MSAAWGLLARSGTIRTDGRRDTTVADIASAGSVRYREAMVHTNSFTLDLSAGIPDPELLPDLTTAARGIHSAATPGGYLDDPMLPELVEVLRADWPYPPEEFTVLNGALDAVDLLVRGSVAPFAVLPDQAGHIRVTVGLVGESHDRLAAGRCGTSVARLAVAAVTAAWIPGRLRSRGVPVVTAAALGARGHAAAGRLLAEATRRTWWPLALLTPRDRRLLLLSLLPRLVEGPRHGPMWTALRVADDLAYGAGVWAGCARERTLAPLLPQLTDACHRS